MEEKREGSRSLSQQEEDALQSIARSDLGGLFKARMDRAGLPMALGGDRGVEPAGRDVILPHADPRLADRDLKPFLTPAEPVLHGLAGGDVQNHPA